MMSPLRRRSERGTTLIEILVAVMLLATLMAVGFGLLESTSMAERRLTTRIENRQELQQALSEVAREIRSGIVATPTSASNAPWELEVAVPSGAGTQSVRFRTDAAAKQMLRERLASPAGSVLSSRVVLPGAKLNPTVATFRYFGIDGNEIDPSVTAPAQVASCTVRIRVTVTVQTRSDVRPTSLWADAALRSRRPEEVTC